MSGMEMLFKSFGLDPEAMTKTAAEFRQGIEAMNANMAKIIAQNQEILMVLHEVLVESHDSDLCDNHPFANDGPVRSVVNHGE